jgi:drug/metabolite transporter (DMT)-like permease
MVIGTVVCLVAAAAMRIPLPRHRTALHAYFASGMGIFGGMTCVYWGARFIPSGWIAVIFGLTPVLTGIMACLALGERSFTPARLAGMGLGLAGLMIIFGKASALGPQAAGGIGAILLAATCQSVGAVWLKRIGARDVPALAVTAGGLMVTVILLGISWVLLGASWPVHVPLRATLAIVYLGVVGSVIGFVLYFYILKHLEATKVALITLVTPVTALLLGRVFNGEPLSAAVWTGTAAILSGLLLYLFGEPCRVRVGTREQALPKE